MIPVLKSRAILTLEERAEKHRMLVRDSVALSTLMTIAIALSFVTYMLFHSFSAHRVKLEERWRVRGEAALANQRPLEAIESLRSALAYSPDDRTLQIELASALAAAGRTQEAVVYFNTLHESQPGDGMINLQLARLAVRQQNVPLAVTYYQSALDGTWNGDGVLRRREVRLELARYLVAQHRFEEARNQLLIAAGNAADNHALQLTVAGLLEQADGDADALTLYRKAALFRDTRTVALVGAGRTAAAQNRYLLARNMLEQAASQPDFGSLPEPERDAVHGLLTEAYAILAVFPAENLNPHIRAVRVAHAAQVAEARLNACTPALPGTGAGPGAAGPSAPASASSAQPAATPAATEEKRRSALSTALGAVQRARESLTGAPVPGVSGAPPAPPPAEVLAGLSVRWHALGPGATAARTLEEDPGLLDRTLQLVYETEKTAAQSCGEAKGEDALLLTIAAAPDQVAQP